MEQASASRNYPASAPVRSTQSSPRAQTGYQAYVPPPQDFSTPGAGAAAYAASQQQRAPEKVVQQEVIEERVVIPKCGSWSEFLKCPLTIYSVLAVIFLIADFYSIWRAASNGATGSSFWITSILSLIIYVVLILLFGYWMKRKCEQCEYGQSWLVFLLAIFFPIILGFIVNVIIGAFAGGIAFLGTSMQGGKSGKGPKVVPTPTPAPVPGPGTVPTEPAVPVVPVPDTTLASEALSNTAEQLRQGVSDQLSRAAQLLQAQ